MQSYKKGIVKKEVTKVEVKAVEPNLVKVMDRISKVVITVDANKEKDFKTKYLHCGWDEFIV